MGIEKGNVIILFDRKKGGRAQHPPILGRDVTFL